MSEQINAYNEKVLKINGKEIIVPEKYTFAQMFNCEMKGLDLNDVQKDVFKTIIISYSVLTKQTFENALNELNEAFEEGLDFSEVVEKLISPITNFFTQTSKNNQGE